MDFSPDLFDGIFLNRQFLEDVVRQMTVDTDSIEGFGGESESTHCSTIPGNHVHVGFHPPTNLSANQNQSWYKKISLKF